MRRFLLVVALVLPVVMLQSTMAQTQEAGGPTVAGSGTNLVPQGKPGILDIVASGPYANGQLPFIIRNNTNAAVSDFTVKVDAKDTTGKTVASGELPFGIELSPYNVPVGGIAFGSAIFLGVVPDGVTFAFTVSANPAPGRNTDIVDLDVVTVSSSGRDVTGKLHNPTNANLDKPFVTIACLDAHGTLTGVGSPMVDLSFNPVDANGDAPFDVPVSTTPIQGDCTNPIVAAYAHHR